MSFVPVLDMSSDGRFLVACEGCGCPCDWLTGLELTAMAIRGYRHFCFDCDQIVSDSIPACFEYADGELEYVEIWFPEGRAIRLWLDGRDQAREELELVLFSHNSNNPPEKAAKMEVFGE